MTDTLELDDLKEKSKLFFQTLRDQSVFKNDPIPEWYVAHEVEGDGSNYCICSTPILHQFTIKNKLNENMLTIGSECVKRWNIKFTCKKCDASLGNQTQRLIKQNFLCPLCTKQEKDLAAQKEKEREALKAKKGGWILFHYGPYYKRTFKEVLEDTEYTNYLLNYPAKSKTLEAFEEYVNLCYDVVLVPVETEDCDIE